MKILNIDGANNEDERAAVDEYIRGLWRGWWSDKKIARRLPRGRVDVYVMLEELDEVRAHDATAVAPSVQLGKAAVALFRERLEEGAAHPIEIQALMTIDAADEDDPRGERMRMVGFTPLDDNDPGGPAH